MAVPDPSAGGEGSATPDYLQVPLYYLATTLDNRPSACAVQPLERTGVGLVDR